MTDVNPEVARRAIVEHTRRLADAAAAAGPDAAVPTAPAWTVTQLVEHVGQTEHWIAEIIERRVPDPTQLPMEMAEVPADPAEWPAWLSAAAQRVVEACSDDAMDAPVWNASGDERTGTEFWMASALNESVVHGADAANAAGRPVDIDADVAAGLITNHLRMLTSPTWAMQRAESADAIRGAGETLQLVATDADAWSIERRPEGASWRPGREAADVTVTGPAQSLLLVLTRRLGLADATELSIDGDAELLRHWIDNTAHVAD
jgi:uncharacterized protein (TIGR03083 family)